MVTAVQCPLFVGRISLHFCLLFFFWKVTGGAHPHRLATHNSAGGVVFSLSCCNCHMHRHKPWLLAVGASDDALRVYDSRMTAARNGNASSSTRAAACKVRGGPGSKARGAAVGVGGGSEEE